MYLPLRSVSDLFSQRMHILVYELEVMSFKREVELLALPIVFLGFLPSARVLLFLQFSCIINRKVWSARLVILVVSLDLLTKRQNVLVQ